MLDLCLAQMKISSAPNKKPKITSFRDIKSVEVDFVDKNPYTDQNYPYTFIIRGTTRDFFLNAPTKSERDAWVAALNCLFEYRERSKKKISMLEQFSKGKVAIPNNGSNE